LILIGRAKRHIFPTPSSTKAYPLKDGDAKLPG
jgi:hypothetical protein